MNYDNEIKKIDDVITTLKALKSDYQKTAKLSEKCLNMDYRMHTPKKIQQASTNLNWQCMGLDKTKKLVWKTIKSAGLEVDLEPTEYNPSGFHSYKG